MKDYASSALRNICIAGHGSHGKTTLTEALLFASKAIDRPGNIASGNTCSDYGTEEIKRQVSLSASLCPAEWKNTKINFIDTPGYLGFVSEAIQGIRAADVTLLVVSAKDGVDVGTEQLYKRSRGKGVAFFVTRLDEEHTDFFQTLAQIESSFGPGVCPLTMPILRDGKRVGYMDLLHEKAVDLTGKEIPYPSDLDVSEHLHQISEAVAETDEALMEKYFADEPFTKEELLSGVARGIADGSLKPVFAGCAPDPGSMTLFLDNVVAAFPSPLAHSSVRAADESGKEIELPVGETEPFAAIVFKTIADPFVGKMSYFRIETGSLNPDTPVWNPRAEITEKIGRIYTMLGKKQIEVPHLACGDIGVTTKLSGTQTGDTLCSPSRKVTLPELALPKPCISLAITAKNKGDEDKIAAGLQKLSEEDRTFTYHVDRETKEQIVSGLGQLHLEVTMAKLKNKFGTEVVLKTPRVPYRETIRKKVKVEGKHKKQSGGHGQYGHVWIEFEPCDSDDLVFEEKVFGGSVPKNYFPAVEKGLREATQKGVLAGYPVVGLKATLLDGSYHPVDSNELAFKVAAGLAFKAGLPQANPVLLEPIGTLKTLVPESLMGAVISDLNKRRGAVLGMNPAEDGLQEITAEVPMAEMHTYATDLRSMTRGRGSFSFAFTRYQEAPAPVAQKVIEEAKKEAEKDE